MRDSYGGENLSEDLLKMNGLSTKLLASLSYPVADGISLKRTLRSVSKELLLQDVISMTEWLDRQEILQQLSLDCRIKSVDSIEDKYCRYFRLSSFLLGLCFCSRHQYSKLSSS